MLKTSELRIGNLVQTKNGTSYFCGMYDLIKLHDNELVVNPVILTEEWLLSFGFKQIFADLFQLDVHDFQFDLRITDKHGVAIRICDEIDLNPVLYVHQFQNLYFSLTGEELKPITEI